MAPHVKQCGLCSIAQCDNVNALSDGKQNVAHVDPFTRAVRGLVGRMVAPVNAPFVTSSEDAFSSALSTLIGDKPLRRRIGEANRVKGRADYSLIGMVDAWRSLLQRQISPAG